MTDEIITMKPKREEKKPSTSPGPNASKKSVAGAAQPRPSSRSSNKKPSSNPTAGATESGSDTAAKKGEGKKMEMRPKNLGRSGSQSGPHRKAQPTSQIGRSSSNNPRDQAPNKQSSPAPNPSKEASDALSSLQRVIADLKTTSPPQAAAAPTNSFSTSISAPQMPSNGSNLAPNAPIFQPGASMYSGPNVIDPKHRKAASLGTQGLSGNFNSFSPHLGAMMEDAEEPGSASFEDGEIPESYYPQQGHQPRSQSQSFMAPRFAALAAQQDQADAMSPSGRPQLAPGFMFGARRRGNSNTPMGPPINEEDVGFKFPQQQQQQHFQPDSSQEQVHRKSDSGEITGIMAEQVKDYSGMLRIPSSLVFYRSRSRTRLKYYNSNNKPYMRNS
jgi:protein SSD1